MYLVSVIPIARGIRTDELTYFSRDEVTPGTLVSVPLRLRAIPALVTTTTPLTTHKTSVRSAEYTLKKIAEVLIPDFLSPLFLRAIHHTATHHAGTIGATLASILPTSILAHASSLEHTQPYTRKTETAPQPAVIQEALSQRIAAYNARIAETLEHGRSVYVIAPTREHAKRLHKTLEHTSLLFHSGLGTKKTIAAWNQSVAATDPIVIVGTGSALALPRADIGLIIVDGEHNRAYRLPTRPFIDIRVFAHYCAQAYGIPLIYGDDIVRIETLWHLEQDTYRAALPINWNYTNAPHPTIVDMRPYAPTRTGDLPVVSDEVCKTLQQAQERHERTLVFTSRRGLAPITVCNDCGQLVLCSRCDASVVLHEKGDERFFKCHRCGATESASKRCASCTSWNLVPLGIGIERVEQALRDIFPKTSIFRGDADHATTTTQMIKTIDAWKNTDDGILLATERTLPYITRVPHSIVASLDSLFAIPDFRMHERIFHLIHMLRTCTEKTCTIQTRNPESSLLHAASEGDVQTLYAREISERKQLGYPPFTTFITLHTEGSKKAVTRAQEQLQDHLDGYTLLPLPLTKLRMHRYRLKTLISLPSTHWPDEKLLAKLQALPPQFAVTVDPESAI